MMEYKGYIGKVEFDDDASIFHGEVVNTRDVITFQGESVSELTTAFRESIDDYLAFCKKRGEAPEKPFSGQFVTRIPPELHRQVNVAAAISNKSLNAWVAEQLQTAVQRVASNKAASKAVAAKPMKVRPAKSTQRRKRDIGKIPKHDPEMT
ncbi:MAG: type II toxin-antitoxin system HicB family antitoxin [Gemmataceae bacterium]